MEISLIQKITFKDDINNAIDKLLNLSRQKNIPLDGINANSTDEAEVYMYNLQLYLNYMQNYIAEDTKNKLINAGFEFTELKKYKSKAIRIKEEVIPACVATNKSINELDWNYQELAKYLQDLRILKRQGKLSQTIVDLLNSYNFEWNNNLVRKTNRRIIKIKRIYAELIPYCERHKTKIKYISFAENPSLYWFVAQIKADINYLPKTVIEDLDLYGMIWKINKNLAESAELLIKYCKNNNANLKHPSKIKDVEVWDALKYVVSRKDKLTEEQIKLLDSYGIKWRSNKKEALDKHINKVITWSEQTKQPLSRMPKLGNMAMVNGLYLSLCHLQYIKDSLSPEIIKILEDHGIKWGIYQQPTLEELITEELLPYCHENDYFLNEIPETDKNGKPNKFYRFVYKLARMKNKLPQKIVKLLDDNLIVWAEGTTWVAYSKRIEELVKYCDEHGLALLDINGNNDVVMYQHITTLKLNYSRLSNEQKSLLDSYQFPISRSQDYKIDSLVKYCNENNVLIKDIGEENELLYDFILKLKQGFSKLNSNQRGVLLSYGFPLSKKMQKIYIVPKDDEKFSDKDEEKIDN